MTSSTYLFGRHVDDRWRLQHQFELLCEDFLAWFERALRRAGLSTDPERADRSALDVGCGAGQYARELVGRYPRATIVGADLNSAAIAQARVAALPNLRYVVHDAREPVPAELMSPVRQGADNPSGVPRTIDCRSFRGSSDQRTLAGPGRPSSGGV